MFENKRNFVSISFRFFFFIFNNNSILTLLLYMYVCECLYKIAKENVFRCLMPCSELCILVLIFNLKGFSVLKLAPFVHRFPHMTRPMSPMAKLRVSQNPNKSTIQNLIVKAKTRFSGH